ncbi:MAG: ribonuclease P protein component [Planctomycetota bacterium]
MTEHRGLPRSARLLSTREFRRVYAKGRRARSRSLIAVGLPAIRAGSARLGLSVSKDHGRAVRRNKIKRLLREAFRLERAMLPEDLDLVLIPRVQDSKLRLELLRKEIRSLAAQVRRPAKRSRGP